MDAIKVIVEAADTMVDESSNNNTNKNDETAHIPPAAASILARLHAGYFTIALSLSSQALLWKTLSHQMVATHPENSILGCPNCLPSMAFLLLWCLALGSIIVLSLLFCLRGILHFKLFKREFSNHIGLNYLFAPWTSCFLLLQSPPFFAPKTSVSQALCWPLVIPVILLDLKLYGQWFTSEKRFLSMVANPTSQMSVTANMVAAWTAAQMGWNECAVGLFSVGAMHYFVVFITLYQRLSGAGRFPASLRPVFFMFVSAPSAACLAWSSILGTFNIPCKMLFFLSLFLLISLACRPALFKKSMKSYTIAWWAYSNPLTFLALASAEYARHIKGVAASAAPALGLTLFLSAVSVMVFLGLMILTALNAQKLLRKNDPFLSVLR